MQHVCVFHAVDIAVVVSCTCSRLARLTRERSGLLSHGFGNGRLLSLAGIFGDVLLGGRLPGRCDVFIEETVGEAHQAAVQVRTEQGMARLAG